MINRVDYLLMLVLNEDRVPVLQQKWANLDFSHDRAAVSAGHKPEDIVSHMASMVDPSPNKQYTDRALQWYSKGQFRLEDHGRVRRALDTFHRLRQRIPTDAGAHLGVKNARDINSYKSVHDLEDVLLPHEQEKTKSMAKAGDRETIDRGSTLLHKDDKLEVRRVDNKDAMMVLGRGTKWCTAAKNDDENMFHDYHERGDLHFIHDKTNNKKYLMHRADDQLMDEQDEPVDHEKLSKKHPKLLDLFHSVPGEDYLDTGMFFDKKRAEHAVMYGHPKEHELIRTAEHSTNAEALHHIALHHPRAHDLLLRNSNTPRDTVTHLVMHMLPHDTESHLLAATHPNTSGDMLDHLTNVAIHGVDAGDREHRSTLYHIVRHKNVNGGTVKAIYDAGEGRGALVSDGNFMDNDNTPREVVDDIVKGALGRHTDPQREYLLRGGALHPNTSSETLAAIHKDEPGLAPRAMARHPNTPGHVLADLHTRTRGAHDHDLAQHPNTPSTTLHDIAKRAIKYSGIDGPIGSASDATLQLVKTHPSTSPATKKMIDEM